MRSRIFKIRDQETIYDMMRMFNNYSGQFNSLHNEMNKLYDFTVAALQWDPVVKKALEQEGRPVNSYNLARTIFNVIVGISEDNAKKGKAAPRTTGDRKLTEVVTQTVDYFMKKGGYSEAATRVFLDVIIARLGVYHVGWEYSGNNDQYGQLFIDARDPREFLWEPNYNDNLWSDAGFVFRKHSMNVDQMVNSFALEDEELQLEIMKEASIFYESGNLKDKWLTKKLKALFSAVYETATNVSTGTSDNLYSSALRWFDPSSGKFDILELHEQRTERRLVAADLNRKKMIDLTDTYNSEYQTVYKKIPSDLNFDKEIIASLRKRYMIDGEVKTDLVKRRFQTMVVPAFNIKLDERAYPFETETYVYIPQFCYDNHADPLKAQSVMDDLIDPQSDFNKSMSLILELTGRYSNNGWIMDENAIVGVEEDWETKKIAPYRRVRAGYINMVKPEQSPKVPDELIRRPSELLSLVKVITNADDEVRGNASPGVTSGKHFIAKEQRQAKSYTHVLKNRDKTARAVYQLALDFIQHFVKSQQIIRITSDRPGIPETVTVNQSQFSFDENGNIAERIINDIDAEKYDIEITEEPYSVSAQDERYNKLGDLFNATVSVNPQKADKLLDVFVEVGGFPEAEKILAAWGSIGQPSEQEQQLAQIMQQIQMVMAKLGIEEKQTEVEGKKLDNVQKKVNIQKGAIDNVLGTVERTQQNGKENNNSKNNGKQKTTQK